MGTGYLLIQLSTAQQALPVTNARLVVTDTSTDEIVFESKSGVDQSGRSPIVKLWAPDIELSLEPMPKDKIPYARYNVSVQADGFNDVQIVGVNIFDETTSIQNISLNERTPDEVQAFFNPSEEKIVIPPHQLLLDVNRDQKTGVIVQPFVLREVYIPEYITVHLGPPTSSAQNVTVRFVDYIKNVASSEIYPTWPEQSLRANIYAQITFALNRVYTEWYRSKGYSFQITNSTAYDQYFVNGRNIFENISKIVDTMFTEYFSIVNSTAPYFTQYCNGTTVKCPGLSQWGTVDLANAGKSAFEILQYYYGNDKILKTATIVAGMVESYPGTAVRLYDINSNVTIVQQQLNRISRNYPAIPKVNPVDGIFGRQTEASVKTFQRVFNLVQDGIVGRATWYKLSAIYTAVKNLAELDQEVEEKAFIGDVLETLYDGRYPSEVLMYGSKGSKVKEFQVYLREVGNAYGLKYNPTNGVFDEKTIDALLEFEKEFNLEPKEIVDEKVWNALYEAYQDLTKLYTVEDLTKYPGYVLRKGMSNKDVKRLQSMIMKIAQAYKQIPEINVDGNYDGRTQNVVLIFQKNFRLAQTGRVDINTWRNIVFVYLNLNSGRDINTSDILLPFPFELRLGDNNGYVGVLKEYMNVLAKNNYNINILPIDNIFDKATEINVRRLQKIFALRKTGIVNRETWEKIASTYNDLFTGRWVR
ncbi:Peptidoglycan-binding (PGRP) domain of peptidoglycan hydrolases-containing protein [Clostridium cavendishii DSM 21758]|uniref:Peptidoglycan-binding (PGRP) domain of peptidoglycan hydrolases-containing protein n=2 Tax=Clostridium TaxID=1485 RepID=A0A1M6GSK9_9CLOT|nr:Peptidoglycan-binding (PGRP) domain of peptidoglycan hydrolases-containing protein [Clostridium cavendishii DSM 21758]